MPDTPTGLVAKLAGVLASVKGARLATTPDELWDENLASSVLWDAEHALMDAIATLSAQAREIAALREAERWLRIEWWGNHGCDRNARYGDDGEFQCNALGCMIDFKREPLASLEKRVRESRWRAFQAALAATREEPSRG